MTTLPVQTGGIGAALGGFFGTVAETAGNIVRTYGEGFARGIGERAYLDASDGGFSGYAGEQPATPQPQHRTDVPPAQTGGTLSIGGFTLSPVMAAFAASGLGFLIWAFTR